MSLINEALKKAQRSRMGGAPGDSPPVPGGGGPIAMRGQARSANSMVIFGSSAIVLVVLSVVATILFVNRSPSPAQVVVAAPKAAATAADSAPAVVKPLIPAPPPTPAPVEVAAPSPTAGPAVITPAPTAQPPASPVVASKPAAELPGQVATAQKPAPASASAQTGAAARPDERVAAYIEAVRITGVRAMGADSRILINERVYRVNDIIERALGIRLIKVESGVLTFSDANGVTYAKYL